MTSKLGTGKCKTCGHERWMHNILGEKGCSWCEVKYYEKSVAKCYCEKFIPEDVCNEEYCCHSICSRELCQKCPKLRKEKKDCVKCGYDCHKHGGKSKLV